MPHFSLLQLLKRLCPKTNLKKLKMHTGIWTNKDFIWVLQKQPQLIVQFQKTIKINFVILQKHKKGKLLFMMDHKFAQPLLAFFLSTTNSIKI